MKGWLESLIEDLRVKDETDREVALKPTVTISEPLGGVKRYRSTRRHSEERRRELKRLEDQNARVGLRGMLRQLRKQNKWRSKNRTGNWDMDISFEGWERLWKAAGDVYYMGRMVPAHRARVLDKKGGTEPVKLMRIDVKKGFTLENLKIVYQKRTLSRGDRL